MTAGSQHSPDSLKIVHVFRAPLGGLFRHVMDLAGEQIARGHQVGLYFDSEACDARVEAALARLPAPPALGVGTAPIRREPGLHDIAALRAFTGWLKARGPDVVHGHGAKGAVYARLSAWSPALRGAIRAYTPHGGSFNYRPGSTTHRLYMGAEKALAPLTDVFLFESAYIAGRFDAFVGYAGGARRIVPNGLSAAEIAPTQPNPDATDLLYIGELRAAKGIDTLIAALPRVAAALGRAPTLTLVGSGPDREALERMAAGLGLTPQVVFAGPMPAREAFRRGRILVVPSRAESLPYVVLEAAAARFPIVSTDVGGIPEIFGPFRDRLGPCDDPEDLARRLAVALTASPEALAADANDVARFVEGRFSLSAMVEAVEGGYREALARRAGGARLPAGNPRLSPR